MSQMCISSLRLWSGTPTHWPIIIMWLVSQHGLAGCVWSNPRRPQKNSKTRAQGSSAAIRQHWAILEALRLCVYAVRCPRGRRLFKKPSTKSSWLMYRTSAVQLCAQSSATRAELGAQQLRARRLAVIPAHQYINANMYSNIYLEPKEYAPL